jgi:hypothetical protein
VSCTISITTTTCDTTTATTTTTTDTTTTDITTTVTTTTTAMSTTLSRQNTCNECETQFNNIWDNRGSGNVVINHNTYKFYLIDPNALEKVAHSLSRIGYLFFEIVGWSLRRFKQGCKILYCW